MPYRSRMPEHWFLADECTFIQTVHFMRNLGFHVERAQDVGIKGADDAALFAKAQEMGVRSGHKR